MNLISDDVGLLLDLGHLNISANIFGFDKYKFLDEFIAVKNNMQYAGLIMH